ncbi:hypothetical protein PV755_15425 [Streptomyces caniscabiei]|uniref:hypothetical protein n=1 Tax=Streptomyces caniscabiei TaxID=2746961 RepID=UPI001CE04706|nr:hypothetical protein [Streptomyces caniscabiei]MDX3510313.1 hypothetical protein [Streptomyces caniscabiei]MDX3720397.1 hypothetical protein [Streptomyces caniscabiei]MDX3727725.1 hypothetical protein [Streptomyces caniscabiei]WEO26299.1 hypothetical protein IHE65_25795 [Streptomyces caniscabiei]
MRCRTSAPAWAPQIGAGDVVRGAYGRAATSPVHEADTRRSPYALYGAACT